MSLIEKIIFAMLWAKWFWYSPITQAYLQRTNAGARNNAGPDLFIPRPTTPVQGELEG